MIDLYTWATPNGWKVSIMLEEVGLPYRVHKVNIRTGEQFTPTFRAISPHNKIPAVVDQLGPDDTPLTVFESGAILVYLAEKADSALLPREPRARCDVFQWLMFEASDLGPTFAQAYHFLRTAPRPVPYARDRFTRETRRFYEVLDRRLGVYRHVAGDVYSLADIALYPSVSRHPFHEVDLEAFPNVERWYGTLSERAAVRRGIAVP